MSQTAFFDQPEYALFRRAYAEKKAPLVIICGSGLSAPAKIPTWPALRAHLQREAERKDATLGALGSKLVGDRAAQVKQQPDMWVAFKLLREILTPPVYDQLIEQYLTPGADVEIPQGYLELLKLQPRGLVTLNLDKFSGEALSTISPGELITPIYGTEIAEKWNQLSSARTFLVYLHGGLHDPSTWVLTQDDLSSLLGSVGHAHFLRYLFTEHTVLFVGISVDDDALSGRLLELTNAGFRPRNLYWLTTRTDDHVDMLAKSAYVSAIRYSAKSHEDHTYAIKALVADCLSYRSIDAPEPPLVSARENSLALDPLAPLDADELAQAQPDEIRRAISIRLNAMLTDETDERTAFDKYRLFCGEYDFAVHRAFYRSKQERFRDWFGYKLQFPPLGRGNFGEVYSAEAPGGETVAIKIMHESIFGNDDMLGGFRRGVRSMQFVTLNRLDGMVPIKESFELPPTIVMPYVSGHSLQESLAIRPDLDWLTKLKIGMQIGQIVGRGHALPQTILHRDLKPSNVMISNLEYDGVFEPEVVVLDFDMSWHKGSKEKDVVFESRDDFGFLAPEQTDPSNRYAARSTRVDSYGLGMTLFYLFGQEAPRPNEALSDLWLSRATTAAQRGFNGKWRSAPARLGRLIAQLTEIDQNLRTDFATATHALEALYAAMTDQARVTSPEIWAEEVLLQTIDSGAYQWSDAVGRGSYELPTGMAVECAANYRNASVTIGLRYTDRGMRERSHLVKYLGSAADGAARELRIAGWTPLESRVFGGEAVVKAEIAVSELQVRSSALIKAAVDAYGLFHF